jgi:hypothetical protein
VTGQEGRRGRRNQTEEGAEAMVEGVAGEEREDASTFSSYPLLVAKPLRSIERAAEAEVERDVSMLVAEPERSESGVNSICAGEKSSRIG